MSLAVRHAAVCDGRMPAQALQARARQRHLRYGNRLRAWVSWKGVPRDTDTVDIGADVSDRLLGGVPVSVKDVFGVRGYPTFAGTRQDLGLRWHAEGFLVSALKAQGATIVGKTKTVELAYGALGQCPNSGTPVNPWSGDVLHVPGGSSCGAGVSILEGAASLAVGTDTGGSVRIPAAMTGTVGYKPSHGLWPQDGFVPLSPQFDVAGLLAASAADIAHAYRAISASLPTARKTPPPLSPAALHTLRMGIVTGPAWSAARQDIADVAQSALSKLEHVGARLIDCPLPGFDDAYRLYMDGPIVAADCSSFVDRHVPGGRAGLHPAIASRLDGAEPVDGPVYRDAVRQRNALRRALPFVFWDVDLLVTPTVGISPPTFSDVYDPHRYRELNRAAMRATNPVNVLGACAMTLPCGLDADGFPVGLQLIAAPNQDAALIAAAMAVESVLGTAQQQFGVPPKLR